jgi:hypothetical protein
MKRNKSTLSYLCNFSVNLKLSPNNLITMYVYMCDAYNIHVCHTHKDRGVTINREKEGGNSFRAIL